MAIKTTINFKVPVFNKVKKAAKTLGVSKSYIVKELLKLVMNNKCDKAISGSAVLYQTDDPDEENWHKFHITFRDDENEYFPDTRKILKESVSSLVAFAVKEFLDVLMGLKPKTPLRGDNYVFCHYVISPSTEHGVISWRIYWGLPANLAELLEKRQI